MVYVQLLLVIVYLGKEFELEKTHVDLDHRGTGSGRNSSYFKLSLRPSPWVGRNALVLNFKMECRSGDLIFPGNPHF